MRGAVSKRLRRVAKKASVNDRKSFKQRYKKLKNEYNKSRKI